MANSGVTSMQGGSRVQNQRAGGPVRRATKPKPAASGGGRGWDDVAAAKVEVFGDNLSDEEEKVPNYQAN